MERPQKFTLASRILWRALQTPALLRSLEVWPSPGPTRFTGSRRAAPDAGSDRGPGAGGGSVPFLASILFPTEWGLGVGFSARIWGVGEAPSGLCALPPPVIADSLSGRGISPTVLCEPVRKGPEA